MPSDAIRQASPSEIPVVDISALTDRDADADAKRHVAGQIVDAAENTGFIYIVNHDVPRDLIDAVFACAEEFFAIPESEKLEIGLENSTCFRGYLPLDSRGSDPTQRNYLEAFQMAAEHTADDAVERLMFGPNQWPSRPPTLRKTMMDYHSVMDRLANRLQRAFAIGIGFPEDYFLRYYKKPLDQLRLLHYPPQPPELDESVMGARPHRYGRVHHPATGRERRPRGRDKIGRMGGGDAARRSVRRQHRRHVGELDQWALYLDRPPGGEPLGPRTLFSALFPEP